MEQQVRETHWYWKPECLITELPSLWTVCLYVTMLWLSFLRWATFQNLCCLYSSTFVYNRRELLQPISIPLLHRKKRKIADYEQLRIWIQHRIHQCLRIVKYYLTTKCRRFECSSHATTSFIRNVTGLILNKQECGFQQLLAAKGKRGVPAGMRWGEHHSAFQQLKRWKFKKYAFCVVYCSNVKVFGKKGISWTCSCCAHAYLLPSFRPFFPKLLWTRTSFVYFTGQGKFWNRTGKKVQSKCCFM